MQPKEKLFVLMLLSLNILQWVSIVELDYGLPQIIKYLFSAFSLGALFYYQYINPASREVINFNNPFRVFFLIWSVYLLLEAALGFTDLFYIQRVFGQRYFYLPYLLPIILLYTRFDIDFFSYFLKAASSLIILSIIIQIYIIGFNLGDRMYEPLHRIGLFDVGSGFVLLTAHLLRKKQISYVIVSYFLLSIFLYSHFGRRGLFLKSILLMVLMTVIRLKSSLLESQGRMILYFYILVFGMFVFILFEPVLSSSAVFQRGFDESAFEASRERVFNDFFVDFASANDWLFGRGLDGHILRTIAEGETEQLIENGYLTALLKGGLFYLIPMLIIMLRACYLGFFKSNNDLAKALASLVLIQIFSMLAFGLPDFSSFYVVVWVAISGCFSSAVRKPDNEAVFLKINAEGG